MCRSRSRRRGHSATTPARWMCRARRSFRWCSTRPPTRRRRTKCGSPTSCPMFVSLVLLAALSPTARVLPSRLLRVAARLDVPCRSRWCWRWCRHWSWSWRWLWLSCSRRHGGRRHCGCWQPEVHVPHDRSQLPHADMVLLHGLRPHGQRWHVRAVQGRVPQGSQRPGRAHVGLLLRLRRPWHVQLAAARPGTTAVRSRGGAAVCDAAPSLYCSLLCRRSVSSRPARLPVALVRLTRVRCCCCSGSCC